MRLPVHTDEIQREHYAHTAANYDEVLGQSPEHELALYILLGLIDSIKAGSVLDVGAGTGRGLKFLMSHRPNLTLHGIEPVDQLRNVAHSNGIPREWMTAGDGYRLPFADA